MAKASPTRRRWFQFGLRELFWLMLVMALVAFIFVQRRELATIREQYATVQRALGVTAVDRDSYRSHSQNMQVKVVTQERLLEDLQRQLRELRESRDTARLREAPAARTDSSSAGGVQSDSRP